MKLLGLVLSLIALILGTSRPGAAEDASAFYAGKTISLVVGYGAGGGYDTFARLIAPELEKATGATVVVRNRPGGGGLVVLNEAIRATPDGLTLTVTNVSAAVTAQLLDTEAARFDTHALVWLGGVESDPRVLLLPAGASLEGWQTTPQSPPLVRWAAGGKTDNLSLSAALISEAFGLSSRIITGYKGTSEAIAALLRGEADAAVVSIESASPAAGASTVSMAAVLSRSRIASKPELATLFEIASPRADLKWIDYLIRLSTLGRALILPPGTPADRIAYLRETLARILTDKAVVVAAASRGRTMAYMSPEALAAEVDHVLLNADPDFRNRLIAVAGAKYF